MRWIFAFFAGLAFCRWGSDSRVARRLASMAYEQWSPETASQLFDPRSCIGRSLPEIESILPDSCELLSSRAVDAQDPDRRVIPVRTARTAIRMSEVRLGKSRLSDGSELPGMRLGDTEGGLYQAVVVSHSPLDPRFTCRPIVILSLDDKDLCYAVDVMAVERYIAKKLQKLQPRR